MDHLHFGLKRKYLDIKADPQNAPRNKSAIDLASLRLALHRDVFKKGWGRRGLCSPGSGQRAHALGMAMCGGRQRPNGARSSHAGQRSGNAGAGSGPAGGASQNHGQRIGEHDGFQRREVDRELARVIALRARRTTVCGVPCRGGRAGFAVDADCANAGRRLLMSLRRREGHGAAAARSKSHTVGRQCFWSSDLGGPASRWAQAGLYTRIPPMPMARVSNRFYDFRLVVGPTRTRA